MNTEELMESRLIEGVPKQRVSSVLDSAKRLLKLVAAMLDLQQPMRQQHPLLGIPLQS